jgi:hypothetical protein
VRFEFLAPERFEEWDAFVERSPQGSIYAKSAYLAAVGCPFRIGVARREESIVAGIPLTTNEARVSGNPLFAKYLGVLHAPELHADERPGATYAVDRLLIDGMQVRGAWTYAFHPRYENWLPFYWRGFRQTTRYTHQISLSGGVPFRARYGEKVKAPLRTARRNGLALVEVTDAQVARLNRLTYEARRTRPPFSDEYLLRFLREASRRGCAYARGVTDANGALHAAALVVHDAGSANLILDGSDPRYRGSGGNTLLIDHMIEFAAARCRTFDFEGSMHERIERFYRGFGGRVVPYSVIHAGNVATRLYLLLLDAYKRLRYS